MAGFLSFWWKLALLRRFGLGGLAGSDLLLKRLGLGGFALEERNATFRVDQLLATREEGVAI